MLPRCIITTSWDDGHHLDGRLAEMLAGLGISATFYVPKFAKYRSLSDQSVRSLSKEFEIGAHGLDHRRLPQLDKLQLKDEVSGSKRFIEDLTGQECLMLAYPFGEYDARTILSVKEAGFVGARRVDNFRDATVNDRFELSTTLQACRHHVELTPISPNPDEEQDLRSHIDFESYVMRDAQEYDWVSLAKRTFDLTYLRHGVWHIWGHSWEIDAQNLWDDLFTVLKYAKQHPGVLSVPNRRLAEQALT